MAKARAAQRPSAAPSWFPVIAAGLACVLWLGWFSPEIYDSDFWWHLKTGQYIVANRRLPVPDPFAFTTASAGEAYPGEAVTRHFNLTHEWLAQVLLYAVWRAGGFAGVVLVRALILMAFCALVGLVAFKRCGGFYRSLAASCAAAGMAIRFALDRPYLITFLLLAATIAILEYRRWLWLLPPLFVFWANCHSGFFLGWLVLAAYSAEALWQRSADLRLVLTVSAFSFLLSGVNPNGFRVLRVLLYYRASAATRNLLEWTRPAWFSFSEFTALWLAGALLMLWAWRRVRVVDWILFAAFGAAAFSAQRNTIFVGLIAPIVIVSYYPWKRTLPPLMPFAASLLLIIAAMTTSWGNAFQLRAAEWRYPSGAADFLLAHHADGAIFNTYEYGGYLIWRLWSGGQGSDRQVFIDGRSLSESLFQDYGRILYNVEEAGGKNAQQLLDRYGVGTIVMNAFEYSQGLVYRLAPALADPQQKEWKLVYEDPTAIVLMRHPPAGVAPLDSLRILTHMEAECDLHLQHEPGFPLCARALAQVFTQVGDQARARQWFSTYRQYAHVAEP